MKSLYSTFLGCAVSGVILCGGLFLLTGCDLTSNGPTVEQAAVYVAVPSPEKAPAPRFTVVIVGEFQDNLAYQGKRRIYEITDAKTGVKYLSATGLSLDRMQKDADDEAAAEAAEAAVDLMASFSD